MRPRQCIFPQSWAGQQELRIFPKMFEQPREEQVETLVHEMGHIFGLRHFFALEQEEDWPSEVFGKHEKFTIMNYGSASVLTDNDKNDLKNLYVQAWLGTLKQINGTPIRLIRAYHTIRDNPVNKP